MCGIVAVLRRPGGRPPPAPGAVLDLLAVASRALAGDAAPAALGDAAAALEEADRLLRGEAGVRALLTGGLAAAVDEALAPVEARITEVEDLLDTGAAVGSTPTDDHEALNAALVRLKDASWAIRRDRLRTASAVAALIGGGAATAADVLHGAVGAWTSIQLALSAIDRLEVRGRDSAGLHVLVWGHDLDLDSPEVSEEIERRGDPLFTSGAVRAPGDGLLAFVYKAAAEIGELGDNTMTLRRAITGDDLLHRALAAPGAEATVLGHTRWASVGIISEANAHPLTQEEADADAGAPYVVAALNGDVDNHDQLRRSEGVHAPADITTDAKVIPVLVARSLDADGTDRTDLGGAFLTAARRLEGSVAIAASSAVEPGRVALALRGSGQALYVGVAEDAFVVASEPYGVVEETQRYLRMDGESPSGSDGSNGQVVVLDGAAAGGLDGIRRVAYAGTELPVGADELQTADITTRDIDRRGAPHFLLKEISESPLSVRKTLRGKIVEEGGLLTVSLPEGTVPPHVRHRLDAGDVRRIITTGQGTAAIAAQSAAAAFEEALAGTGIAVTSMPATELSGFRMDDDMADALVVAISQSGTTTDTNRTVDLVRARGAAVLAIVNRRNSDLVEKADGVLYTSDGRDVEMAVPSTKAFYAQVAAGFLLALGVAEAAGALDRRAAHSVLEGLRSLPDAMEKVLALRDDIGAAARRHAPPRRHWAVVGNGRDRIAAEEVRIKLSELCYMSISCDATEDKKHIDLAAEPLIFVCGAGLTGANADDVAKEVAIYRAHKAAPIVVTSEGAERFAAALEVIHVPVVHPAMAFVLSAMAGHLFGYEAALAIDAQALPLREARSAIEETVAAGIPPEHLLEAAGPGLTDPSRRFNAALRAGEHDGHLEASTAVRVASLLRYATGVVPLHVYELEHGRVGSPSAVVQDLLAALGDAIDELTRPIDAIKHQAKTVTVGISRAEDALLTVPLVRAALEAGAAREQLGYRALRTLAALDPAVVEVAGWTRYRVEGDVTAGTATAHVVDKGGVARDIPSRTSRDPRLRGIKRRAATEREVTVARGGADGRTLVVVPEVTENRVTGITLLHAEFVGRLDAAEARRVLTGYRNRYSALVDAVTETVASFDDEVLERIPLFDLLVEPVRVLAERWPGADGGPEA